MIFLDHLTSLWPTIEPTLERFVFPVIAFVGGILIKGHFDTSLKKSIATFESSLRNNEAEDQAAREQVALIYKNLIERSAQRNSEFEKKKIEAIEQCWDSVLKLTPLRIIGSMSASVKLRKLVEGASKQTIEGQRLRDFANTLLSSSPDAHSFMQDGSPTRLNKVRLYLSEETYDIVTTYNAIILRPFTLLRLASGGLSPDILKPYKDTNDKLKSIIPAYSEYLDQYGEDGYSFLYEVLEEKILARLRNAIGSSPSHDIASIKEVDDLVTSYKQSRSQADISPPPGLANTTPPPR